jgi:hypothetical protein
MMRASHSSYWSFERRLAGLDQRGAGASALAGLIGNSGLSDHLN